jgi:hypothetical protein
LTTTIKFSKSISTGAGASPFSVVKVFDDTRCRRNYHVDSAEEDDWRVFLLRSEYRLTCFRMFFIERTNKGILASLIFQFG